MIIVPKEKPVICNLNTYYIDVPKLIEHYQGEIGCGGVFFKSAKSNAVLFFDQIEILNGTIEYPDETVHGQTAIGRLTSGAFAYNMSVAVHRLAQEDVYFWANLPGAEILYKDLSTDFTDLQGLIKKMEAEKLTGYIEVSIHNKDDGGIIFISNGGIVGGSFSWDDNRKADTWQNLEKLIGKTKQAGGVFQVSRLTLHEINSAADDEMRDNRSDVDATVIMLEEMLGIFDSLYTSKNSRNNNFSKLLRKKFMDHLDRYEFLDPFAAEFEYDDHKVTFGGNAGEAELARGVCLCVKELAEELGLTSELRRYLNSWYNKYESRLANLDVNL